MDYTAPGFDPSTLRVVDLKRVLGENNISWPSRHRKSDLVEIFTYELVPKLKREKREKEKRKREKEEKKKKKEEEQEQEQEQAKDKGETDVPAIAKKNPIETSADSEERKPLDVLTIKKRESLPSSRKRKHSQLVKKNDFQNGNDTALYDDYSDVLQRKIKRKRNFSEPGDNIKQEEKKKRKEKKKDVKSPRLSSNDEKIDFKLQPDNGSGRLENTNLFNRNGEIKFNLPDMNTSRVEEHANINQIANSTFSNQVNISALDNIRTDDDDENTIIIKKELEPNLSTPAKIKGGKNILSGPVKDIRLPDTEEGHFHIKKELEDDIKVKLEKIETLRTEIRDELRIAGEDQKDFASSDDIKILDALPSHDSLTNLTTFDSDSQLLTQLQNDFEIENSRVEIEAETVSSMVNSKERFKFYKSQFIRIFVVWTALLAFSFALAIYIQERIQVGFCGCGSGNYRSFLFRLLNVKLNCVDCPDHAVCYPNSELSCLPEYLVSRPLFWSLWGLIPTYNKCILDSTKVKKIDKTLKFVLDLLSRRNASIRCGDGSDKEAGLSWRQIVETIDQRLANDSNDKNYSYIWDKVKVMLTTRTDLKFIADDASQKVMIRSLSLSKLSVKCRLKKLIITILIKYKVYLLSVVTILLILTWIFYKVNQVMSRNESYRTMVKEIINKLQKQASESRRSGLGKPYIAKIQLRDYYLPQLHNLSKKNRTLVWKQVVRNVESNSNIKTEDIEVNGDIMRVWSWCSDI